MDGLWWKTLLKWMIWGYPYFRKHPYQKNIHFWTILQVSPSSFAAKSSSSKTTILLFRFETGDHLLDGAKTPVFFNGILKTNTSINWWFSPDFGNINWWSPVVWRSITFYKRSKRPILSVYWCMGPTQGPHCGPLVREWGFLPSVEGQRDNGSTGPCC